MNIQSVLTLASSMAINSDLPHCHHGSCFRDELNGIDIKSEYALIVQKKSKLNAGLRRTVCARYEKLFAKGLIL